MSWPTWYSDSTEMVPSGWLSSLYPGGGVRGSAVPSGGTNGPPPLYNDITLPGEANDEFRIFIDTWPAAGTLTINEDSSLTFTGPAGTHTFTYTGYKNYVSYGSATVTIQVGTSNSGSMNAVEVGSDTAVITAQVLVAGLMAAAEANTKDTLLILGNVIVTGVMNVTETGSDAAAIVGSAQTVVSGYMVATEAGPDTFFSGLSLVTGLRRIYAAGLFGPTELPNLDVKEFDDFAFIFTKELVPGETITTVTFELSSTPENAATPLYGPYQILPDRVLQRMRGTTAGDRFHLRCIAVTKEGRRLTASCDFGVGFE